MRLTRTLANTIFVALGCATAASWNTTRMNGQLMKVGNLVTPETNLGENDATLRSMLAAIASGEGVALEDEAPVVAQGTPAAQGETISPQAPVDQPKEAQTPAPPVDQAQVAQTQATAEAVQTIANNPTQTATTAPAPAAATVEKKTRKRTKKTETAPAATQEAVTTAAAAKATPAPAAPAEPRGPWDIKAPGVRADDTNRGFTAGLVIANFGLANGVGDAQAALYEQINNLKDSGQTRFNLANAWHMINGYLEGERRKQAGLDPITGQPVAKA